MAQVTLYIDDETDAKARAAAASRGVSYSRWLADLIRVETSDQWPAEVRALRAQIPDFPDTSELRARGVEDIRRESIE